MIEEDKIEREAHAKRVDAGTAGNQQPGAGLVGVEAREPEESGAEPRGDADPVPENKDRRQAPQPSGENLTPHSPLRAWARKLSPSLH